MRFTGGDQTPVARTGRCLGSAVWRAWVTLFAATLATTPPSVTAAPTSPVEAKKVELQDLQSRIDALRQDMAQAEASKGYAVDQLRETESAVSDANRRLHELGTERRQSQEQMSELETQSQRLDRQTRSQQNQLGRLLNRQFIGGDPDALQLLLAGRNPNQAARDQYFLNQLSRAKADLIQQLRGVAAEKIRLAEAVRERQAQLAEIERRQKDSHAQLLERKKQRETTLVKIASRIQAQQQEIDTLRRDEQRMGKLIEGLARIAATRKAKSKKGAGTPAQAQKQKNTDPGAGSGAFSQLRGKLKLPVKGRITGRYGRPRAEGGTTWKGIFIRASEGIEVKTIAAGTVVFSDWMRGFGNLLVVDHGDDFLSIYGNNESLLVAVGALVSGNQSVATVGNSGGNPDSGLYFELRHQGQAFDPLKWAAIR